MSPLRLLLLLLSLPTVPFSSRCREPASRAPLARKPFFFFFVLSFFRFCILFSFVSSFLLTYEALQNGTHSRRPKGESRRRGSPLPALPLIVFALAFKAFFRESSPPSPPPPPPLLPPRSLGSRGESLYSLARVQRRGRRSFVPPLSSPPFILDPSIPGTQPASLLHEFDVKLPARLEFI